MMKRFFWLFICLFFLSLFLMPSIYAIFCSKQGDQNPYEARWSSKWEALLIAAPSSPQSDIYAQAEALFKEKKYDDVILLLSGPAYAEHTNLKINILLAKAQVEKCAILKVKGDDSYKMLIQQPYETGQRLHKLQAHPEIYYIVAKSLLINNRITRAKKNIKKALRLSPNNADYLIVLGDANYILAEHEEDSSKAMRLFSIAKDIYQKAIEIKKDAEEFRTNIEEKIKNIEEKIKELPK
jgi:tetratricopeptide (TPR) repeat protein